MLVFQIGKAEVNNKAISYIKCKKGGSRHSMYDEDMFFLYVKGISIILHSIAI